MTPLCLIFHELLPPDDAAASPLMLRGWALARQLSDDGLAVTILHTEESGPISRGPIVRAAREAGAAYRRLDALVPPDRMEVFPAVGAHRLALRLKEALAAIEPRTALFFGHPAHASAIAAAQRCGLPPADFSLIIALDSPEEFRLQREGEFPLSGRNALAADFLERKAVAGADALVCGSEELRHWLEAKKWALPAATLVDSPGKDSASKPAGLWRELLELKPRRAPATPVPRVSVCVTYYEKPKFLAEALASLAAQSLPAHEVIVLDDGSASPEAAAALAAAEALYRPRGWKFLRQENQGPAAARNSAARAASGEAILFCDADNRFRPTMIADLAHAFGATGADCVACGFQAFSEPSEIPSEDPGYRFIPLGACLELGVLENVLGDTNSIFRRDAFFRHGGFSENNRVACEDWGFLFNLVRNGGSLEVLPEVLFEYRIAPGSYGRRHDELAAAEAALAPELAAASPLWHRLWLFLAGSVRDTRLPRLEAVATSLRSMLAKSEENLRLTRQHASNLDENLRLTRQHVANLEKLRGVLEQRVGELEAKADQLADALHGARAVIQVREDKIQAIQRTFSWRATSFLRYLRRAWIDPRKARLAPPPVLADAVLRVSPEKPAATLSLAYSVDSPQRWNRNPGKISMVGWCYSREGRKLTAVRAVLPGRVVGGVYGLKRNDVLASAPDQPQTEYCGWKLALELTPEDKLLDLEVGDETGAWQRFFHTGLWIGEGLGAPDLTDYDEWIEVYDRPDPSSLRRQAELAVALLSRPLISVVMPVYNPPKEWLSKAVESVRAQTYQHWELCVADDASTDPEVRPLLEKFAREDPRIKVLFRDRNGHISAASNSALALASGDYVAFLDHDDELSPSALYEVAALLNAQPETDWIYSDEDKIDEEGRRHDAYFKPDFLPDLFLAQNYTSHLSVYRSSLVRAAGGFREGYEGSQDWDLALRILESTDPERIRHIPKILYHWRAIPGSTALRAVEKNYPADTANRALADHFRRLGRDVALETAGEIHWRVRYPLPPNPPLVSLIIPTRNGLNLLRCCVDSILEKTTYPNFELLIVDNGSDDPAAIDYLKTLGDGSHPLLARNRSRSARILRYDAPFNYSAINNFAVRQARGVVIGLLNNDLEVITPGWLDEMTAQALRPEIGCVGAMLYYPNDTIQHAGCVLGIGGVAGHVFKSLSRGDEGRFNRARLAQNYSALTGACLVLRKSIFDQVGGLDEKELAVAFNDIDLCLKVRQAGYWNLWTPFAELYHHESASRGADNTAEKAKRFQREAETMMRRWGPLLQHDPAYNPNLSLERDDFSVAALPRSAAPLRD